MTSSFGIVNTEIETAPPADAPVTTLGDVIFTGTVQEPLAERDWAVLVSYIAAGDQAALRQLYERTHRLVFSLIVRITHSRETADDLTVDVFLDIWKKAATYDPTEGSVVAWIMNQARRKAIDRLRLEQEPNADVLTPAFTAPRHCPVPLFNVRGPDIFSMVRATDSQRDRVSMLVRLAPGVDYPPHTHAGVEELHLLHGELWIDQRKLHPGDYNRAEPGTSDARVWSETGCTCVLVTSPRDVLG